MARKTSIRFATSFALTAFCAATYAASPDWFGGIRVGTPSADGSSISAAEDPDVKVTLFRRVPLRLKFGVELGLHDPRSDSGHGLGLRPPGLDNTLGWQVLGVGTMPITKNIGLFGKLGAYRWSQDINSNLSSINNADPRPTYGLGLRYDFTRNFSISGEWDRYQLGPSIGGLRQGSEIDLLSIGLKYSF